MIKTRFESNEINDERMESAGRPADFLFIKTVKMIKRERCIFRVS